VAAMARARWIVLPVVLAATVVTTLVALQIEARFDVKDFFAADTDLVESLDKLDEHVGQQGGEPAMVY
ncbi:MAG: hypothetical protein GTN89_02450, partial [Acidobacteria bacterium]|nr:hypothetical protein [Acidobacteriota bacterium]